MTEAQKEKWLRFYFNECHGSTQGEELLALISGVRDEALEEAALIVWPNRLYPSPSCVKMTEEIRALKAKP